MAWAQTRSALNANDAVLSVDVMDVAGEHQSDIAQDIYKVPLDEQGTPLAIVKSMHGGRKYTVGCYELTLWLLDSGAVRRVPQRARKPLWPRPTQTRCHRTIAAHATARRSAPTTAATRATMYGARARHASEHDDEC